MEEIEKNFAGIWTSKKCEDCPKQNHINLGKRLALLCPNGKLITQNWFHIKEEREIQALCICGHSISNTYIIRSFDGKLAQIGVACAKRINHEMVDKYKEDKKNKKKGYCKCCNKNIADLDKHYESNIHINNYKQFEKKRNELLEMFIQYHLNTFIFRKVREEKIEENNIFLSENTKCETSKCDNYIANHENNWKKLCIKCFCKKNGKTFRGSSILLKIPN